MRLSNAVLVLCLTILASCGSTSIKNKKHFEAKAVSMTIDLSTNPQLIAGEKVTSQHCLTNTKAIPGRTSNFLYDELIYQTQQKYQADAIVDVIFSDSTACVELEGRVANLKK